MRARLARLGVEGIEARTFHAVRCNSCTTSVAGRAAFCLEGADAATHRQLAAAAVPLPAAADIATEIEWAKNRQFL